MQFTVKLQILQFIVQIIVGAGLLIQGYLLLKKK
jgi:hypothetical protein